MAVSLLSIFVTALFAGLVWFFLLSVIVMFVIKMAEFRKPSITRMSKACLTRYLVGSAFAGLTAVYFFVREGGQTQEEAWVAVVLSVLLWSVLVIVLELLAIDAQD